MTFKEQDPMDEIEKVRNLEIALIAKRDMLKHYYNPILKDNISITVNYYNQVDAGTRRLELQYNNDTKASVYRKERLEKLIISFIEEELIELNEKIQNIYKEIRNE